MGCCLIRVRAWHTIITAILAAWRLSQKKQFFCIACRSHIISTVDVASGLQAMTGAISNAISKYVCAYVYIHVHMYTNT